MTTETLETASSLSREIRLLNGILADMDEYNGISLQSTSTGTVTLTENSNNELVTKQKHICLSAIYKALFDYKKEIENIFNSL